MDDSERKGLTGREKTIIFIVLLCTIIVIGAWIFLIITSMPNPSAGLM